MKLNKYAVLILMLVSANSFAGLFNRPPDFSGFNGGVQEGLNNAQSLAELAQEGRNQRIREGDYERYIHARDAFGKAYATHDPNEIVKVVGQYPEYADWGQQLLDAQADMQERIENQ